MGNVTSWASQDSVVPVTSVALAMRTIGNGAPKQVLMITQFAPKLTLTSASTGGEALE
jgi:hypothetical protein